MFRDLNFFSPFSYFKLFEILKGITWMAKIVKCLRAILPAPFQDQIISSRMLKYSGFRIIFPILSYSETLFKLTSFRYPVTSYTEFLMINQQSLPFFPFFFATSSFVNVWDISQKRMNSQKWANFESCIFYIQLHSHSKLSKRSLQFARNFI